MMEAEKLDRGLEHVTISAIGPDLFDATLPVIEPLIDQAVEHSHGEQSTAALLQKVLDGDAVILSASYGTHILGICLASRVVFQSGKAVLFCDAIAGDNVDEWIDEMLACLKKLARAYNCQALYGTGRHGWVKFLEPRGFHVVHQTMSMEV